MGQGPQSAKHAKVKMLAAMIEVLWVNKRKAFVNPK